MTVKQLIEELQKYNEDSKVVIARPLGNGGFNYVNEPKLSTSKNIYGDRVWII